MIILKIVLVRSIENKVKRIPSIKVETRVKNKRIIYFGFRLDYQLVLVSGCQSFGLIHHYVSISKKLYNTIYTSLLTKINTILTIIWVEIKIDKHTRVTSSFTI